MTSQESKYIFILFEGQIHVVSKTQAVPLALASSTVQGKLSH